MGGGGPQAHQTSCDNLIVDMGELLQHHQGRRRRNGRKPHQGLRRHGHAVEQLRFGCGAGTSELPRRHQRGLARMHHHALRHLRRALSIKTNTPSLYQPREHDQGGERPARQKPGERRRLRARGGHLDAQERQHVREGGGQRRTSATQPTNGTRCARGRPRPMVGTRPSSPPKRSEGPASTPRQAPSSHGITAAARLRGVASTSPPRRGKSMVARLGTGRSLLGSFRASTASGT